MEKETITIWHSRLFSPTRRVAAHCTEDVFEPVKEIHWGSIRSLWGDCVAALTIEEKQTLVNILNDIKEGFFPASRLRHRIQTDHVGLSETKIVITKNDYQIHSRSDAPSSTQILLGIIAAIKPLDHDVRSLVADYFISCTKEDFSDSNVWACAVLGLQMGRRPTQAEIKKAFRSKMKLAHPDTRKNATNENHMVTQLVLAKKTLLNERAKQD
jgi:hypothetical protein